MRGDLSKLKDPDYWCQTKWFHFSEKLFIREARFSEAYLEFWKNWDFGQFFLTAFFGREWYYTWLLFHTDISHAVESEELFLFFKQSFCKVCTLLHENGALKKDYWVVKKNVSNSLGGPRLPVGVTPSVWWRGRIRDDSDPCSSNGGEKGSSTWTTSPEAASWTALL